VARAPATLKLLPLLLLLLLKVMKGKGSLCDTAPGSDLLAHMGLVGRNASCLCMATLSQHFDAGMAAAWCSYMCLLR
jgi:hypothetical protein